MVRGIADRVRPMEQTTPPSPSRRLRLPHEYRDVFRHAAQCATACRCQTAPLSLPGAKQACPREGGGGNPGLGNWLCFRPPPIRPFCPNSLLIKHLSLICPPGNWLCLTSHAPAASNPQSPIASLPAFRRPSRGAGRARQPPAPRNWLCFHRTPYFHPKNAANWVCLTFPAPGSRRQGLAPTFRRFADHSVGRAVPADSPPNWVRLTFHVSAFQASTAANRQSAIRNPQWRASRPQGLASFSRRPSFSTQKSGKLASFGALRSVSVSRISNLSRISSFVLRISRGRQDPGELASFGTPGFARPPGIASSENPARSNRSSATRRGNPPWLPNSRIRIDLPRSAPLRTVAARVALSRIPQHPRPSNGMGNRGGLPLRHRAWRARGCDV